MTSKPAGNSNVFSREEAKRTLDEIRKRYGIHLTASPEVARGRTTPAASPNPLAAKLPPRPLTPGPAAAQKPAVPAYSEQLGPPVDFEWRQNVVDTNTDTDVPPAKEPQRESLETQDFHFLVRVLECSIILHCQVTSDNIANARKQLERIPNLIEWREISAQELAQIMKIERDAEKSARRRS